jgi:TetR/AcrR family transcriptional repressor of nem operon
MTRGPDKQFDPNEALEKAMILFWAKGYSATGMSELQAELGIGRKSLYDTFGCKRDLYIKALEKYGQFSSSMYIGVLNKDGSVLEQIRVLMRDIADMNAEPGSLGCMLGVCSAEIGHSDPEIAGIAQKHLGVIEQAFFNTFERAKQSGEIGLDTDSRDLARMFVALIQGIAVTGRTNIEPEVPHSGVEAALGLLNRV